MFFTAFSTGVNSCCAFPLLAIADAICSASVDACGAAVAPPDKIAMTDIGRELNTISVY